MQRTTTPEPGADVRVVDRYCHAANVRQEPKADPKIQGFGERKPGKETGSQSCVDYLPFKRASKPAAVV